MLADIAYDLHGTGQPIVLLHGFPLNRRMWRPQVGPMVEAGYKVVCPDLPGFGESPPLTGSATMSGYADAVIALLDRLGLEQAVIGGMSMGGYVLLNLAERYPERLFAAMFLVTRAAADDASGKEKRTHLTTEVEKGNLTAVPDVFEQVLFAPDTPLNRPGLVDQVREWMELTPAQGVVHGLLAMRERDDYLERLSSLNVPSLVVGAERDLAVPPEHARQLAAGLPQAELKIIPGAGHMVNMEEPDRFNQVLLDFLRKIG